MRIKGVEQVKAKNPVTGNHEAVAGKYRILYKDASGKWRYKLVITRTLTQAKELAVAIRADAMRGKLGFAEEKQLSPTLESFSVDYMEHAKATKRDWLNDDYRVNRLVKTFGWKRLNEITSWDIEQYRLNRRKEVKPGTVNRELALLRRMLNLAIEWGMTEKNPVITKSHFFKEPAHRIRVLEPDEEKRLMMALDSPQRKHIKGFVTVALHTGCRRGELLNLKWKHVDFGGGCIAIEQTKSDEPRTIPMNRVVRETLRELPRLSDFVFGSPLTNEPMKSVRTVFEHAVAEAGIENLRVQDLRHTCATRLVAGGVDVVTVKEILGHNDIKMTLRCAQSTPENKRKAMDCLAEFATEMLLDRSERKVISF